MQNIKLIRHDKKFILVNINTGLFKKNPTLVIQLFNNHGAICMTMISAKIIDAHKKPFFPITLYTTEKRYKMIEYELLKLEL
jgi:hypothetical protein